MQASHNQQNRLGSAVAPAAAAAAAGGGGGGGRGVGQAVGVMQGCVGGSGVSSGKAGPGGRPLLAGKIGSKTEQLRAASRVSGGGGKARLALEGTSSSKDVARDHGGNECVL